MVSSKFDMSTTLGILQHQRTHDLIPVRVLLMYVLTLSVYRRVNGVTVISILKCATRRPNTRQHFYFWCTLNGFLSFLQYHFNAFGAKYDKNINLQQ